MSFKKLLLLLILSVSSLAMVAQIKVTGVVLDETISLLSEQPSFRKATEEMVQLLTSMVNSHLQCPPKPHL